MFNCRLLWLSLRLLMTFHRERCLIHWTFVGIFVLDQCFIRSLVCLVLVLSSYSLLQFSCRLMYRLLFVTLRPLAKLNPDETKLLIQRSQKKDSNTVIHRVWCKPLGKSRFSIPLCRLRCFPLVQPINDVDVARLENEFVMDCRDGDRAIYVSSYNNLNEILYVSNTIATSFPLRSTRCASPR